MDVRVFLWLLSLAPLIVAVIAFIFLRAAKKSRMRLTPTEDIQAEARDAKDHLLPVTPSLSGITVEDLHEKKQTAA